MSPRQKGESHIVFDAVPVGISIVIGMMLSFVQYISWIYIWVG